MNYWEVIHRALGARKYVLGSIAVLLSGLYDSLRQWLVSQGVDWLPALHPAVSMLLALLLLLTIFFVVRLKHLEEKFVPRIAVSDPISYTDPKEPEGKATTRTFKVTVSNESSETIKGCELKLVHMENVNGGFSKEVGRPFKQSLEGWDFGVKPYSKSFDIKPRDSVDVDLVRYGEQNHPVHVTMCYAIDAKVDRDVYVRVPVHVCPHTMTLRAVAENARTPVEKTFRFYVTDKGFLTAESV